MTEQEALEAFFAEWDRQANEYGASLTREERDCAEEAWNAAIAWLRLQGAPVAHGVGPGDWTYTISSPVRVGTKLFLAPQPAIPDGYLLVPVEPTEAMLEAAASWGGRGGYSATRKEDAAVIWRDMLNAAPEPRK